MPMNIRKTLQENRINRIKRFPFIEVAISIVVVVVLLGLFIDTRNMNPEGPSRLAQSGGSNALEFDVINVNPIIAKDFGLPNAAGVLVNNAPKGVARRIIDLRRGDIILKYNSIDVQSSNHLSYLMSQNKPGDMVSFVVWRNTKMLTMSDRIPVTAGIDLFGSGGRDIIIALVIIIVTFTMLFMKIFSRAVCMTLGAVLMLVGGSICGFYSQTEAFDAIRMSPIFIFLGMSVFAIFLEELKFFDLIARRLVVFMNADKFKVILALAIFTFAASAFVNNITVVLAIVPITIYAARNLNFNPIPAIVFESIAANIGGTATAISDFPNMLIASSTGLKFVDFLIYLTPVCVLLMAVLAGYIWFFSLAHEKRTKSAKIEKAFIKKLEAEIENMPMDTEAVKRVLFVLGSVIVASVILPIFRIPLAAIALGGGFVLLAVENKKAIGVIKKIKVADIIFYIALFLLVGGALYSGLLKAVSNTLMAVSMGNKMMYPLLVLWLSALFTAGLNAGPTTAFLVPIVMHSGFADFTDVVWWALALGVLAGSTLCITGSRSGIISQNLIKELQTNDGGDKVKGDLTSSNYSRFGLPVGILFLVIATVYIMFLNMIP